ncbi:MAG TPA: hypothetical protein VEW48_00045 [Thermoanaerobaculia bacterium]|nr:hypothetical protein [Thermoanaerobaculia bacterium]
MRWFRWVSGLAAVILSLFSGDAAAAPPAGPRCEQERAKADFTVAMEQYDEQRWAEAIRSLEQAAKVCPVPEPPWSIYPNVFREISYLPYYFLGDCHLHLEHLPDALRNFYLSRCVGEPARSREETKKLASLTESCRLRIRSTQRPPTHPYFVDGYAASQQGKWAVTAEKMWDALQVWEEDGKTTTSSGRFPAPYLPRFRLADALFQLGCYREACAQLDQTVLMRLPPQGRSKEERKRMDDLVPQCKRKRREGFPRDSDICQQWRCWLGQGAP